MFKVLDLFSGIGGFSLGLEATGAFRTIAFCEQDRFCQAVLRKHWPGIPIYPDVKTFDFQGECDVITGGYPCQSFSVAGKRKGAADDRHLWPHMFEIVAQKKPSYVICENVYGHVSMGLDQVLLDLASQNYTCLPFVVGACAVNAPHRRQRVWVIARKNVANRESVHGEWPVSKGDSGGKPEKKAGGRGRVVANPDHSRDRASRYATVRDRAQTDKGQKEQPQFESGRLGQNVADTKRPRTGMEEHRGSGQRRKSPHPSQPDVLPQEDGAGGTEGLATNSGRPEEWCWEVEPGLGLPIDGLSRWVAGDWERGVPRVVEKEEGRKMKLQALGNAVVPQIVEQIGLAIIAAEQQ